jgi:hypothetical protein
MDKRHWDRFLTETFGFLPSELLVSVTARYSAQPIHTLPNRTTGEGLRTFERCNGVSESWRNQE